MPTLDLRRLRCTVFKPDRVSDYVSELALFLSACNLSNRKYAYLHLLTDTLGDRHCSHSTRLCAPNYAICTVSVLVEELSELSRFTRTRLTDDHQN